ncbi:Cadmium, zinc and cobalt-transporting ATPase CadA [Helicobacter mustelae]|uniref:heavy metal translocating P-type ATPase n=1 Tax=Helicobacter mustelae TaxID=217 RepID=UPI000DFDF103|nr:heavy metal translocating P-type ATPase [Helicobacter mustelae]STP13249.1 Cadmium, zinc and cobalt-transporting ATPase CadA [Helicobacter mustelae]
MQKFLIKNLDCASCADKLEKKIKNLSSVREVKISFATGTLYIDCDDWDAVRDVIAALEPSATLESMDAPSTKDSRAQTFSFFTQQFFLLITLIASFLLIVTLDYLYPQLPVYPFVSLGVVIYLISGRNVFRGALKSLKNREFFDENILMLGASIAAFCIGAWEEAVSVMLFFSTGEYLQEISVQKSKAAINQSANLTPSFAHKISTDSQVLDVDPKTLQVGDRILLYAGEMLPCDARLLQNHASFNCAAISGESLPINAKEGEEILSGSIALKESIQLEVLRPFEKSQIAKITELIASATTQKSKTESFITTFARYYTPVVFVIALLIAILPPLLNFGSFEEWIYRALVVMMVSCPCALIISVPIGYFGGLAAASKHGILIKGANYLEALSQLGLIAFDKTGTLTQGKFSVTDIIPAPNHTKEELLESALCAQSLSNHPIAQSIKALGSAKNFSIDTYEEFAGMGVRAVTQNEEILAGNEKLLQHFHIPYESKEIQGSVVHIAKNQNYLGYLLIADVLKSDSKDAILALKKLGIDSVMLSGDGEAPCRVIAEQLQCPYYHSLLPQDKARIFSELKAKASKKVAFVGDGINDAPTIALADVGMAMGSGSDISTQSADVILLNSSLSTLLKSIKIAQKTKNIIYQNIFFALGIKAAFIILGLLGMASIWEAVFGDVGVALLALANAMRALKIA